MGHLCFILAVFPNRSWLWLRWPLEVFGTASGANDSKWIFLEHSDSRSPQSGITAGRRLGILAKRSLWCWRWDLDVFMPGEPDTKIFSMSVFMFYFCMCWSTRNTNMCVHAFVGSCFVEGMVWGFCCARHLRVCEAWFFHIAQQKADEHWQCKMHLCNEKLQLQF